MNARTSTSLRVAATTAVLVLLVVPAAKSIAQEPAPTTVLGLRQAGWVVTDQQQRLEPRPSVAPYDMLPRRLVITDFRLERGAERKQCMLAYDTMLEKFTEECRDE